MEDLIQNINTLTTGGTDHSPVMIPDIGDITADHSPTPIYDVTEAATSEGTPHALLIAITAAPTALQLMDVPIMITTGIVAPHPALTISVAGDTYTTPQTRTAVTPATPTMQCKILSPGRQSNDQYLKPP